ncbi:hypothetical protein [Crossiella sp. S99.1]|uniref:hypothetical protein n=2 Tax=unclassified Crossiella TaxID=2620835 RepID=UPI00200006A9|nr:hypothetical protein [Crossiella sp. S99.1]MCK2240081.1 hypothetical protein [Crossiella sp. S99.2]MCK2252790.1 hypothetical protein [Crossiella sp. S99.1]
MFGENVETLFGPPIERPRWLPVGHHRLGHIDHGRDHADWQRQVMAMCAEKARGFLSGAGQSNVGRAQIEELADDIKALAIDYPVKPVEDLIPELARTQIEIFDYLRGKQPPLVSIDLHLLAGVASGLLAKASHDLRNPREAMTHARTAAECASLAGHPGLQAWAEGMRSMIEYWTNQYSQAARSARRGIELTPGNRGSSAIWLASSEARALAAQGRITEAKAAIEAADRIREVSFPDTLDEIGGLFSFSPARGLYYAADALARGRKDCATETEEFASRALAAYSSASPENRSFGDEAGSRCDLAIARIHLGNIEGAAEAIQPVLELPRPMRIHGIVASVEEVEKTLSTIPHQGRAGKSLSDEIVEFRRCPLSIENPFTDAKVL